jgi:hypothetical protein
MFQFVKTISVSVAIWSVVSLIEYAFKEVYNSSVRVFLKNIKFSI